MIINLIIIIIIIMHNINIIIISITICVISIMHIITCILFIFILLYHNIASANCIDENIIKKIIDCLFFLDNFLFFNKYNDIPHDDKNVPILTSKLKHIILFIYIYLFNKNKIDLNIKIL